MGGFLFYNFTPDSSALFPTSSEKDSQVLAKNEETCGWEDSRGAVLMRRGRTDLNLTLVLPPVGAQEGALPGRGPHQEWEKAGLLKRQLTSKSWSFIHQASGGEENR